MSPTTHFYDEALVEEDDNSPQTQRPSRNTATAVEPSTLETYCLTTIMCTIIVIRYYLLFVVRHPQKPAPAACRIHHTAVCVRIILYPTISNTVAA